ncbi:MAG: bifunctional methylenetetrahydrofolate dehydrogenase/methenyltetrahydrofolate cyclohydrolase FolD [Chlamydiota bacterium]
MKLLDGKSLSVDICQTLKREIATLTRRSPALAFILIGEDPASQTYVRLKKKQCREVGIQSQTLLLPSNVSKQTLIDHIQTLNQDPMIDGILVQQPLPKQIATKTVFEAVDPAKDVDGFHPLNLGKLLMGQSGGFIPCTPLGIIKLLEAYQIPVEGRHAVILGRSHIVGKPLAALLVQKEKNRNATVTLAHRFTRDLAALCRSADILIAAMGSPRFIKASMVKPGAVVVDVGINRVANSKGGYSLIGDVAFDEVATICSAITPVPGGVGPMTIAMLLANTLTSYRNHC